MSCSRGELVPCTIETIKNVYLKFHCDELVDLVDLFANGGRDVKPHDGDR